MEFFKAINKKEIVFFINAKIIDDSLIEQII